jgi:hypothetical protein
MASGPSADTQTKTAAAAATTATPGDRTDDANRGTEADIDVALIPAAVVPPPPVALLAMVVEKWEVVSRRFDASRNLAHWDENMVSARGSYLAREKVRKSEEGTGVRCCCCYCRGRFSIVTLVGQLVWIGIRILMRPQIARVIREYRSRFFPLPMTTATNATTYQTSYRREATYEHVEEMRLLAGAATG